MSEQTAPVFPDWLASQLAYRAAWAEHVIARYLTVAGATLDITYDSPRGVILGTCTGCDHVERTDTGGLIDDNPEKEAARVEKALPDAREQAQAHAEKCRALPRPAVGA